jgi:exodeoxyribonuclease VII small subunit
MNLTYEQAIKKLEDIVNKLNEGSIPLDESIALYEEGIKLSEFCMKKLNSAKQRIINLNEEQNDD